MVGSLTLFSYQGVDLIHTNETDPYACTLMLFCMCYDHLLMVLDDEEVSWRLDASAINGVQLSVDSFRG